MLYAGGKDVEMRKIDDSRKGRISGSYVFKEVIGMGLTIIERFNYDNGESKYSVWYQVQVVR